MTKFKHNKTGEEVEIEKWVWAIVYKDDTELHQFDLETNLFHSITEVDKSKGVKMLTLYRTTDNEDMSKRFDIIIPEDCDIFVKYRNVILEASTPEEVRFKVYMFGYGNKNYQVINYILPNDKLVQAGEDIDIINFI